MPIRKRIPATRALSGQSKRFLAALVLAHTPVQKNCMTLHDVEALPNLHFLSSPATLGESQKNLVFRRILPMKTGVWLGPESNRRHVDFQSTALPTELPSLLPMRIVIFREDQKRHSRALQALFRAMKRQLSESSNIATAKPIPGLDLRPFNKGRKFFKFKAEAVHSRTPRRKSLASQKSGSDPS